MEELYQRSNTSKMSKNNIDALGIRKWIKNIIFINVQTSLDALIIWIKNNLKIPP